MWFFNLPSAKKKPFLASNVINLTLFSKWLRKSAKSLLYKTKKLRNSEPAEVSVQLVSASKALTAIKAVNSYQSCRQLFSAVKTVSNWFHLSTACNSCQSCGQLVTAVKAVDSVQSCWQFFQLSLSNLLTAYNIFAGQGHITQVSTTLATNKARKWSDLGLMKNIVTVEEDSAK